MATTPGTHPCGMECFAFLEAGDEEVLGSANADSSTVDLSPKIGSQPAVDSPASVGGAGSNECIDLTSSVSSPEVAAPQDRPILRRGRKATGAKATQARKSASRRIAPWRAGNFERKFAVHNPAKIHAIYVERDKPRQKKQALRRGRKDQVMYATRSEESTAIEKR